MGKRKHWSDYLWIATIVYFPLGLFNILFAWLGMICFITPLTISLVKGNKSYCNRYCGRGQLLGVIGGKLGVSRGKNPPKFLSSNWFRYGFLTFFMSMFLLMVYNTVLVFQGLEMNKVVTILWTFQLPWEWAKVAFVPTWVAQFSFGFFSVMVTSTVLGLITMVLFKPRTWCVYCPMGTMTQGICMLKHAKGSEKENGTRCKKDCATAKSVGQ